MGTCLSYFCTIFSCCFFFQLSYSSASPALSDKTKYKRFFRVFPPESSFNPAKFDLLDMFNWKKVATLNYVGDEIFSIVSYNHITCQDILPAYYFVFSHKTVLPDLGVGANSPGGASIRFLLNFPKKEHGIKRISTSRGWAPLP